MQDVTVVGGGVVGLTVARELAGRGVRVRVIEARRVGAGASAASVGVLSAPTARPSALARLSRRGFEEWGALALELQEETGVDVGYRQCGALHLTTRRPRRWQRQIDRWAEADVAAGWLEGAELGARIPGLSGPSSVALALDREAVVRPAVVVEALSRSCRERGVEILEEAGEVRLRPDRGGGVLLEAADGSRVGDADGTRSAVVLAAGSWSREAAGALGSPGLPVAPVRGQALELRHPAPASVVHFEPAGLSRGYYIVPRDPERVWVGSTVEDVGFDDRTTDGGVEELLAAARAVLPDVSPGLVERAWAGLRPRALRRGGPFLGAWPGIAGLWVACGHYRSGVLQAPATARLMADSLLDGGEIDDSFSVRSAPPE